MKKIHIARLKKLIAFLRKLPEEKFQFETEYEKLPRQKCPTVACAIGWTPAVFPELVGWAHERGLFLWKGRKLAYSCLAEELFGIPSPKSVNLFYPNDQKEVDPLLPLCGRDAKPEEVANMLEKFLELQTEEAK